MPQIFKRALFLFFLGCFLIPSIEVVAQSRNTRVERLRDHEKKIREIIKERRKKKQEEETTRRQQEIEDRRNGVTTPLEDAGPVDDRAKMAVSSVVMGFKFLNEKGESDYNITVIENEIFLTEIYLFNIDQNPIDEISLALDYDKRFIQPVKVFDTPLAGMIEGTPDFEIDTRNAILLYSANLKNPLQSSESVLLRILWKAIRPTPYTGIEFAFDMMEREDQPHTAMYVRGNNILGVAEDPADGVLSGGLMIMSPNQEKQMLQGKAEELREIYLGSSATDSRVGLSLDGSQIEDISVGEEFVVTVALNNPEGALIDIVNFSLLFDPKVLQVVDTDQFNYINRGVNIHDGPYSPVFTWDLHKRNEARNDRGLISYQMGLFNGASLPSEPMADVHFRAIAPATETAIGFVKGRPGAPDLTSIRYFGYELVDLDTKMSVPSLSFTVFPGTGLPMEDDARSFVESQAVSAEDLAIRQLTIER
jgi:hypothetical protein